MAVSKKRSPYVKIENRAFQQVYDDLNDVIDNVNQYINIESFKSVVGDLVPDEDLSYSLGDENNSFKNIYAEKFYGDGSLLTGISAGGTSIITSGGVTPSTSNASDKTPNIGDIYLQYKSNYVSNGINNETATGSNAPIIYIRATDEVVLKIYNNGSYYVCKEHVDTGYVAPTPEADSIVFCDSSGNDLNSYYLVGTNLNAYARCTYNSDVSGGVDGGPPRADFLLGDDKDFDSNNNTRTSSANTGFSSVNRDGYISVGWVANGATEGGIAVADGAGIDSIYARNNRLWGAVTLDFENANGTDKSTALSNASYELSSSNNYKFNGINGKSITNSTGNRIFFAIPNTANDITDIRNSDSNYSENLINIFATTTATYTNANSIAETYKIWYIIGQQGGATITWKTS